MGPVPNPGYPNTRSPGSLRFPTLEPIHPKATWARLLAFAGIFLVEAFVVGL